MTAKVNPVPDGYHTVTPYLAVKGAAHAIEFYTKAFGAKEMFRLPAPDGKLGHAEIMIGDSFIMLADENPDEGFLGPQSRGGATSNIMLYVEDVDALVRQAVAAGATLLSPVEDKFYGDRSGRLADPFGHLWDIATHVEDVAPEEMEKRIAEGALEAERATARLAHKGG